MAVVTLPEITVGQVPTGADVNGWLDTIAAGSTGIVPQQLDADCRMDRSQFAQDEAVDLWSMAGYDRNGEMRTFTAYRRAPANGTLIAIDTATDGAGPLTNLTVSVNGVVVETLVPVAGSDQSVAPNDAIAADDEIEVVVPGGVAVTLHIQWGLVA